MSVPLRSNQSQVTQPRTLFVLFLCVVCVLSNAGCRTASMRYAKAQERKESGIITPESAQGTSALIVPNSPRESPPQERQTPPASSAQSAAPQIGRAEARERALALLTQSAQTGSPEERANALEGLVPTPARLAGVLEAALADQNLGVRSVAAMCVGKAKIASLTPRVAPLLSDQSPLARAAAMYAMKRCGESVDLSPLAEMLASRVPSVRSQAAFVLGELGEKSAIGPLKDAARDTLNRVSAGEVRVTDLQIAEARAKLGDDAALADIRTALFPARTEDLEGAVLAAQVAGQVGDKASASQLVQLTRATDDSGQTLPPELRMASAAALAKLNIEPRKARFVALEFFAGEKDTLRAQSAYVFGESGDPESLGILVRMMDDPIVRVRIAAASAIVRMVIP